MKQVEKNCVKNVFKVTDANVKIGYNCLLNTQFMTTLYILIARYIISANVVCLIFSVWSFKSSVPDLWPQCVQFQCPLLAFLNENGSVHETFFCPSINGQMHTKDASTLSYTFRSTENTLLPSKNDQVNSQHAASLNTIIR
jgi:hypothetical protein